MAEKTPEELAAEKVEAERAEAQRKADAKAEAELKAYLAAERKTLIRMTKGSEESFVHPSAVKSHEEAGWTAK